MSRGKVRCRTFVAIDAGVGGVKLNNTLQHGQRAVWMCKQADKDVDRAKSDSMADVQDVSSCLCGPT